MMIVVNFLQFVELLFSFQLLPLVVDQQEEVVEQQVARVEEIPLTCSIVAPEISKAVVNCSAAAATFKQSDSAQDCMGVCSGFGN